MNPKDKAEQLYTKYGDALHVDVLAKQCTLIAVTEIINSNPHSNPFNTDIHSTMQYWIEVKNEIEKL